jgi:hypothetical protein
MANLDGRWKVERERGLLPPGLRKRIIGTRGWTQLGPIPLLPFRIVGSSLRYPGLPLRDELVEAEDGTVIGQAYAFGLPYGCFRLTPLRRVKRGEAADQLEGT